MKPFIKLLFLYLLILVLNRPCPLLATNNLTTLPIDPLEARISRINKYAKLVRFRIRDENMKFLTKGDKIDFWNPDRPDRKCLSTVVGKSDEYLLLRVLEMPDCLHNTPIVVGAIVHLSSKDYIQNMKVAHDLMNILNKKHQAISGRLHREKKNIDGFVEKFDALNDHYEVLMGKLQGEWQQKLSELEEDRIATIQRYKNLEIDLSEIEHKMQQYQIKNKSQLKDEWMLESRLHQYQSVDIKKALY